MANIKIEANILFVESAFTLDQLKKAGQYNPEALAVYEGEGKEKHIVYRVATSDGKGSVSPHGVTFAASSKKGENFAVVGMEIPEGVKDAKEWAVDKIGRGLARLKIVEEQVATALAEASAEKAEILASIQ